MNPVFVFMVITALVGTASFSYAANPSIDRIIYASGDRITISGSGFGKPCKGCEVHVHYSRSVRYAAPVVSWTDKKIAFELADLNQNDALLQVQVSMPNAASKVKPIKLRRKEKLVRRESRAHSLSVGDKGEDLFPIKSTQPQCGQKTTIFSHAEIEIKKNRFADALIVQAPPSGCEQCSPVVVRWYNEPTGKLEYVLKIFNRTVQGICKNRVRDSS